MSPPDEKALIREALAETQPQFTRTIQEIRHSIARLLWSLRKFKRAEAVRHG